MNMAVTDEQRALRGAVRQFVEQYSTDADVRRLIESEAGYDAAVWTRMGEQIGLQGVAIPEQYGGGGAGFVELAIVLEEMGRRLFCSPFFATTVLAGHALLYADDEEARGRYLPGIAAGETIATLAWVEAADAWRAEGPWQTTAEPTGSGWRLHGTKSFVLDGTVAGLILVAAATAEGNALFAVSGEADGLTRLATPALDQTRRLASLTFDATPAHRVDTADADDLLSRVLDVAAIALAAEQVGTAEYALEAAVEYAKTRIQFDRPIASFQAVKHRCAEMLVAVEAARSAAYAGASGIAAGDSQVPVVAAVARTVCAQACSRVTADSIQIYGGIGFTWEHPAHLSFKRAKSSELMFGTPAEWRELLARRLGL